ncbi:hypothetical protein E5288_WYG017775 [Bos mutus]|uniref:Uncharacterized protein n=1 Tax=Bos mutus TaxID=72004 RepID=A0A6B0RHS1_9CETA|nr:hypothetical protein [Bos mutus]
MARRNEILIHFGHILALKRKDSSEQSYSPIRVSVIISALKKDGTWKPEKPELLRLSEKHSVVRLQEGTALTFQKAEVKLKQPVFNKYEFWPENKEKAQQKAKVIGTEEENT